MKSTHGKVLLLVKLQTLAIAELSLLPINFTKLHNILVVLLSLNSFMVSTRKLRIGWMLVWVELKFYSIPSMSVKILKKILITLKFSANCRSIKFNI